MQRNIGLICADRMGASTSRRSWSATPAVNLSASTGNSPRSMSSSSNFLRRPLLSSRRPRPRPSTRRRRCCRSTLCRAGGTPAVTARRNRRHLACWPRGRRLPSTAARGYAVANVAIRDPVAVRRLPRCLSHNGDGRRWRSIARINPGRHHSTAGLSHSPSKVDAARTSGQPDCRADPKITVCRCAGEQTTCPPSRLPPRRLAPSSQGTLPSPSAGVSEASALKERERSFSKSEDRNRVLPAEPKPAMSSDLCPER